MIQTLSLAMSQHLSSLAPGFEGHWWWCKYTILKITGMQVVCIDSFYDLEEKKSEVWEKICPAWQVEDVLKNMTAILLARKTIAFTAIHANEIASILYTYPNTAYQKIEEYLWSVIK